MIAIRSAASSSGLARQRIYASAEVGCLLPQRIAMARNSLNFEKKFTIRRRYLRVYRSWGRRILLFDVEGSAERDELRRQLGRIESLVADQGPEVRAV